MNYVKYTLIKHNEKTSLKFKEIKKKGKDDYTKQFLYNFESLKYSLSAYLLQMRPLNIYLYLKKQYNFFNIFLF